MRTVKGSWSFIVLGSIVFGGMLSGCGGSSGGGSSAASTAGSSASTTPTTTAQGPKIQGVAPTTATAGQPYTFQPQASGGTGSISFTIANKPAWASFDAKSGALSGTPDASQVGLYSDIEIAATDGVSVNSLPAFNITVAPPSASQATTLSWVPPTQNTDGSSLGDLKGFKIHYGTASQSYTDTIDVNNPGLTTYVVQNLGAGTYYFTVTAYNSAGVESPLSAEVSTQVD
jgi:hypothetical protein